MENFIICGLTGWGLEILLTSAESLAVGDWKMMGRTSLYMFPIYGLGVLLDRSEEEWTRGLGISGKSLCGTGSFAMGSLIWC